MKTIKERAFCGYSQMTTVNLGEGREEISVGTFGECTTLHEMFIPHTVRTINDAAFYRCTLGRGLEVIGGDAFSGCTSLHEISIPPAVKNIEMRAFYGCSQLVIVNGEEGLEELGEGGIW